MSRYGTPELKQKRNEYCRNRRLWLKENKPEVIEKELLSKKQYYQNNKEEHYKRNRLSVENNREKDREYKLKSYHKLKSNPEKIKHNLWKNAKARAVQSGKEFSIVVDDIFLPEVCPILGREFDRSTRRLSHSLDRKDTQKGYTKDNIWVISQLANAMKWDSTHEERVLFAKWVLALEGG